MLVEEKLSISARTMDKPGIQQLLFPIFFCYNIIVYKDELYAAVPHKGVFKSPDGGITWQNISTGLLFPDVSDFCEFKGDLYAATLGNSVFKLDPVNKDHWLFFGNGLSDLSANLNTISGNDNALVAGTNANGIYDYLPANSTTWEERFLAGRITPNEKLMISLQGMILSSYKWYR